MPASGYPSMDLRPSLKVYEGIIAVVLDAACGTCADNEHVFVARNF